MKKISSIDEISSKYSTFFFDLTGVLWQEEKFGQKPIPQTFEALRKLSSLGKNIFFISNNSVSTRSSLQAKIKNYGFPEIKLDQIFTSAFLAAKYIQALPQINSIYAIGMAGLYEELKEVGIPIVKSEDHNEKGLQKMNQEEFDKIEIDEKINCVCVGIDLNFNYYKLCFAGLCIEQNKAIFVACDEDSYIMVGKKKMPINGCMVEPLIKLTGIRPAVCGKPNSYVINCIQKEKNIAKGECIMIGDSIESDLKLAKCAEIDSIILLSGVSKEEDLKNLEEQSQPTYFAEFL